MILQRPRIKKIYNFFFAMERYVKVWNNPIHKPSGVNPTFISQCLNNLEQTGSISNLALLTRSLVRQVNTRITWTLKGSQSDLKNLVFRVTIILSQPFNLWLPFDFSGYFPGLGNPPTEYLFDNYYPSCQIRTPVLDKISVLHDKCYLTNSDENVIFDEITIPELFYSWGKPNDLCPRMNSLWFLVTALDCSNFNTALFWSSGQNSAPSYDLCVSYFLE